VELALVMIFILFPLTDGILQVGRLVQVMQLVSTSAREGCRVAAQGVTIQENGSPTQITSGSADATMPTSRITVRSAAFQSLRASGLTRLTWADVACTFAFVPAVTGKTEPYQGTKNQNFSVTVSVPWSAVRWPSIWAGATGFGSGVSQQNLGTGLQVRYTAHWQILVDETFTLNLSVPGVNPIR
jgi:hypothetical protein